MQKSRELVSSFLDTMDETKADFTNCFRCLSKMTLPGSPDFEKTLEDTLDYLLTQCCTAEELREACKPQMDPRYSVCHNP